MIASFLSRAPIDELISASSPVCREAFPSSNRAIGHPAHDDSVASYETASSSSLRFSGVVHGRYDPDAHSEAWRGPTRGNR